MLKSDYQILSVGGSIIIPSSGFDSAFLRAFRRMMLSEIDAGKRFILIIGGGATARVYQDGLKTSIKEIDSTNLDWIGIQATIINAHFVRQLFHDVAYKQIITDPRKKVATAKPLIISAGWKPGASTDYQSVCLAKTYAAERVINLSNIDAVYDKDPNKYSDAKRLQEITWKDFRRNIVGDIWEPGKSAPFDPIASKLAEKLQLQVQIVNGTKLAHVKKAIQGSTTVGTSIHP